MSQRNRRATREIRALLEAALRNPWGEGGMNAAAIKPCSTGRCLTMLGGALLLLMVVALSRASADETRSCTQMGCGFAFTITIRSTRPLEAGAYDIQLRQDRETADCRYVVPASCVQCGTPKGIECFPAQAMTCTGSHRFFFTGLTPSCNGSPISVIGVFGKTAEVSVRLSKDGRVLGAQTYTPQYERRYPNGVACGPECWGAPEVQLTLEEK